MAAHRRPLILAVVLALAGAAVLALTTQQRDTVPSANRALLDAEATTKVTGDVSNALVKIFSYRHGDVATTERTAAQLLEGRAAQQYRGLFPQVKQQAPNQKLDLSTRVVRIGVTRLTGDSATLLAFLDQQSTRNGRPAGGTAAAQLVVTAHLRDGQWRIAEIRSS